MSNDGDITTSAITVNTQIAAGSLVIQSFDMKAKNLSIAWSEWKRLFEAGLKAFKCDDPDEMLNCLLFRGGSDIIKLLDTLPESEVEGLNVYQLAIKKLDAHFLPKKNKIFERHLFRKIVQLENEKFDQFILRVRAQANNCEFTTFYSEAVLDQIVEGCKSRELKTKCLASELKLDDVISLGNSLEIVECQVKTLQGGDHQSSENDTVNRVSSSKWSVQKKMDTQKQNSRSCFMCGDNWFIGHKQKCKAVNHICSICKKKGHLETKCFSKKRGLSEKNHQSSYKKNKQSGNCYEVELEDDFGSVEDEIYYVDGDVTAILKIGNVPVTFILDTGSQANLIDTNTYGKLMNAGFIHEQIPISLVGNKNLKAYAKQEPLKILSAFSAMIDSGVKSSRENFYVIENASKSLLGKVTCLKLELVKIQIPVNCFAVEVTHKFPCFKGIKAKLLIDKNVDPVAQGLRRVPVAFEDKIELKIKELLELGIIEPVTDPNPGWVSPVVPVGKSDGDLRLCVDMRKANQAITREAYPLPTFDNILVKLSNAKIFSKLDLKNAYHQVELTPDCRYITTFLSKQGLFQYTRLMFGISAAPEKFQKIMDNMLAGCDGVAPYIDDILIFGSSLEEHDSRLENVLNIFKKRNVLLNQSKCVFRVNEVVFMGHKISSEGIKPLESKIDVLRRFRAPQNVDEVRSFLGLVTYHAKFIKNLATMSEPLRILLKKDQDFFWEESQQKSFQYLTNAITCESTLGFFDKKDTTKLICDASPVGLGAVLVQTVKASGISRTIAYASRSLSDTEKKYYHTEKETLAIVWGIERFKYYLTGIRFELITDCKPLETLFKPTSKPCARIERWILRLQSFDFVVKYKSGKTNIADPLSRLVIYDKPAITHDVDTEEYVYRVVTAANRLFTVSEMKDLTTADSQLMDLKTALSVGRWNDSVKCFERFQTEICEHEGLLLRGTRVIPPKCLRMRILDIAHEGHMGIVKMKHRLRASYWWPGLDQDVSDKVKMCKSCTLVSALDPPPPMTPRSFPDGPWQHLAMDFLGPIGSYAEQILVVVDYYSRFMELAFLRSTASDKVIYVLRGMIGRHGYPITITADNGSQFRSEEFLNFCEEEGIVLNLTTPYWPQANGEVERQNRSLKKRIQISVEENRDWKTELLKYQAAYHVTPHCVTGKAPAELFKGVVRDKFPVIQRDFRFWDEEARDKDTMRKGQSKTYTDRVRRARENDIDKGDIVLPKRMRKENKTVGNFDATEHTVIGRTGNEAVIQNNETGVQYRRHVHHLKKFSANNNSQSANNSSAVISDATIGDSVPANSSSTVIPDVWNRNSVTSMQDTPMEESNGSSLEDRPRRTSKKPSYLSDFV